MKIQKKIRKTLLKYISTKKSFDIPSRSQAIKKCIQNASPKEIILVAGKGHEESQIYKNKTYKISDKKIISSITIKSNKLSKNELNNLENKLILQKIVGKKDLSILTDYQLILGQ